MTTGRFCRIDVFPEINSKKRKIIIFGKNIQIGDNVHIAAVDGITIEDNCLIASNVFITDHDHGNTNKEDLKMEPKNRIINSKKVRIGQNCWIGQNVCILKGCVIGENSVIGAGAVVTKSFPPYSILAGNPAKIIKNLN